VEHQHPLAEPRGADLEASAIAGKGVGAQGPIAPVVGRRGVSVVLAIVEDDFEHPAGVLRLRISQKTRAVPRLVEQWRAVPIKDSFQVAVGGAAGVIRGAAVALAGSGEVDTGAVFPLVLVQDGVALVVAGFADQPAEHPSGVGGVGDARLEVLAVEGEDVVLGDRSPVDLARFPIRPALDARKQPLDAGTVAVDGVVGVGGAVLVPATVGIEHGDQVFGAGQNKEGAFPIFRPWEDDGPSRPEVLRGATRRPYPGQGIGRGRKFS
jgi:hypothetical protein